MSMTHKRTDWRLSFNNGDKHARQAEKLIDRWLERPPYTVVGETNPQTGEYVARAKQVRQIPNSVRLRLQDALTNYRVSLDQILYRLTIAHSGQPKAGVAFPIAESEEKFLAIGKTGKPSPAGGIYKLRGVSEEVFTCIEWLQPYNRSDDIRLNPLYRLNALRNVMHNQLQVVGSRQRTVGFSISFGGEGLTVPGGTTFTIPLGRFGTDFWMSSGIVESGAPIAGMNRPPPILGVQPEVEVTPQPPFSVVFGPPSSLAGEPVISTLWEIRNYILDDVFPFLEPFL